MAHDDIMRFARSQRLAALATVTDTRRPQVAMVNFVMTETFEVFFGAFDTSRKVANLRRDPHVALAIAEKPITIQLDGIAEAAHGPNLARARQLMQSVFPEEFRIYDHKSGYHYFCIRPTWLRFIDFSRTPNAVIEVGAATMAGLGEG